MAFGRTRNEEEHADQRDRRIAGQSLGSIANRARTQAQHRLKRLDELDQALKGDSQASRQQAAEQLLNETSREASSLDLKQWQNGIESALGNAELGSDVGDVAQDLIDALRIVEQNWPEPVKRKRWTGSAKFDEAQLRRQIERCRAALEDIVFGAEMLTLPRRLRKHLEATSVGRALVFDDLVEDETVDEKQREQLLAWIAPYGRSLGALVDEEAGLVYKLSPNRGWRLLSYSTPILFPILGLVLLLGVSHLDDIGITALRQINLDQTDELLAAYLFVLVGAILHLVVENLKQAQMESVPILAIDNFLAWFALHWTGLLNTLGLILVVVIGMRVANISTSTDFAYYIFAGYSFDSVAGLFLTRFNVAAGKGLRGLRRQIKLPEQSKDETKDTNEHRRGRR